MLLKPVDKLLRTRNFAVCKMQLGSAGRIYEGMTAKDLLHKALDYECRWSKINAKPATIRLAQIHSMQRAFGLMPKDASFLTQIKSFIGGNDNSQLSSLHYLLSGKFLNGRPEEQNRIISERARTAITELYPNIDHDMIQRSVHISWLFNNLIRYRENIYDVTYPDGGMLEGFSTGLMYSFHLKAKLKKVILDNLNEIDETLWLILDPLQRYIDKEVLIKQYNYPDADLGAIDREWRMQNY